MYDEVAAMSGVAVPSAEVAETASYGEIASAVKAVTKNITTDSNLGNVVVRYVKRAAEDTTLKNVTRDKKKGAQFAWVPAGDTCAFCLMLASNGWQNQSAKAMRNGHASHIHPNCDCTYSVRFDGKSGVKGYDPDKYKAMYQNAEGRTWNDKLNSIRRIQYQQNKDVINAQKRANYALKQSGGKISGGHRYLTDEKSTEKDKKAAAKYEEFSRYDDSNIISKNTGFSRKDIQTIRSHIFYKKHKLEKGYDRFDPDYDMAVAWQRLKEGNYLPRDITLLNHELLESQIEKEYNLSATEAHEITQKTYNWIKQLMDETNGKGEEDDLL